MALAGEVDESDLGTLRAVLAGLPPGGRARVDATTDLRCRSAAAARGLLDAAGRTLDLMVTCTRPAAGAPAFPTRTVEITGTTPP